MMDRSPRCQRRDRGGLEGNGFPRPTNCSISEPFALSATQDAAGAGQIVVSRPDPVGVAEIEFCQIPMQVGFGDVLIDAIDAAFQDREVPLNGVGVHVSTDVLLGAVVNATVAAFEFQPIPV